MAITPLTDRCWATIMAALNVYLGCSPQGPAGTGKTESVKDLARNLAKQCIIFNCSELVTIYMIQVHFLGMILTGSWLCLDEFNRIDIEVLSVIAQQVLLMKNSLVASQPSFIFNGVSIESNNFTSIGVFTTMNPGYAGRTELPENLKILFRPVAMIVPDLSLICEILLFSEGFFKAKELSLKTTKLFELAK